MENKFPDFETFNRNVLPVGSVMYYRNVSTGSPTMVHLINDKGNSYCGFKSDGAEVVITDESDNIVASQVCKTCFKLSKL